MFGDEVALRLWARLAYVASLCLRELTVQLC